MNVHDPDSPVRGRRCLYASLALCLVATLSGCGSSGRPIPGQDPFSGGAVAAQIRIRIRNNNFYDATITAIGDTGRRRLGTVSGNQTTTFTMPWAFTGSLRLEVDLLAGGTCVTDAITVNPGDQVDLQIQSTSGSNFCR